ncbi:MAG: YihY/virulence factor BrkB family protein [Burkholderiaceae bacterium]
MSVSIGQIPSVVRHAWFVTHTAVAGFMSHNAPRLSASLSFYSVFSLAPLLVLVLAIVSLVLDAGQSREFLMTQLADAWGQSVADTVGQMIDRVNRPGSGARSAIIAFGGMAIGATAVFVELKRSLDDVFGKREAGAVKPAWYSLLAVRVRTVSLILALALLMLASLLLSASLTTAIAVASSYLPPWIKFVWIADQAVSIAGAVVLYYFVMRFFPERMPSKAACLRGALVSALLFSVGRHLIGLYIGMAGTASAFGAAGTLAVILIWMHYTWQILIFGAEVARAVDLRRAQESA